MTVGHILADKRSERGLTIEQASAATRIRAEYLSALESDEPDRLPAAVYARGYLRTYARYLGLDPEPLVDAFRPPAHDARRSLELGTVATRPRVVLTAPAAAAVGLVFLAAIFAVYAWRQIEADPGPGLSLPSLAISASPATALPSPSPQPRPIVVGVRLTDSVWLSVIVDGRSQYPGSGRTLPAGSQVYFTGLDIKITSGRAAATLITIDGQPMGALGSGVATREFTSQT